MEEIKKTGTENMPEPQTLNYDVFFRVTQTFVNDIQLVLGDMSYADVKKVLDVILVRNGILPVAVLNELIRTIAGLPYKYVYNIMTLIGQPETFAKYFIELDANGNPVKKDASTAETTENNTVTDTSLDDASSDMLFVTDEDKVDNNESVKTN